MTSALQITEAKRKTPVQSRAVRTVETLLDAAAQVLQREGEARFTTNRVAAAAGFSIGTLYQYFPDKDAIAQALVRRECARIEQSIRRAIAGADASDLDAVIRAVVRTVVRAFEGRPKVRKALILRMVRLGRGQEAAAAADAIGAAFVQALAGCERHRVRPLSEATAFVLTRSLAGAVRAAVLEESPLLATRGFEDELVELGRRFVQA